MNKVYFTRFLRRIAELIVPCIILSAIVTLLNVKLILPTRQLTFIALGIGALIYVLLSVRFTRNSAFRNRNLKVYYIINYAALLLFAVTVFVIYRFFGNYIFTWMFALLKVLCYSTYNIPNYVSVGFMFFLHCAIIAISPLGMSFITMYHEDDNK